MQRIDTATSGERTHTHTESPVATHMCTPASAPRARACVCLIFYKFERSEIRKNKNDWKCFISMACHYILFEKTKSEALGERSQQQKRRRYTKRTCIERIGAYNVMLCRKFIFNRLCTAHAQTPPSSSSSTSRIESSDKFSVRHSFCFISSSSRLPLPFHSLNFAQSIFLSFTFLLLLLLFHFLVHRAIV